jgi:hypothetical protein
LVVDDVAAVGFTTAVEDDDVRGGMVIMVQIVVESTNSSSQIQQLEVLDPIIMTDHAKLDDSKME